jgi:hypothetical protein
VTISFPVLLLIAALVGVVLAMRSRSSGSSRIGQEPWWNDRHMPWGGADEPFHPRDRDLRERAWEEAEAEHRRAQTRAARAARARMDDRYGGDFVTWTTDDD